MWDFQKCKENYLLFVPEHAADASYKVDKTEEDEEIELIVS